MIDNSKIDIICSYYTFYRVESIVEMQIIKYLYRAKFEWPNLLNGPIISFLCYAATSEEAEITAQEIGTKKARDMHYIGVELLPFGLVISSFSAPVPATIMVDVETPKE